MPESNQYFLAESINLAVKTQRTAQDEGHGSEAAPFYFQIKTHLDAFTRLNTSFSVVVVVGGCLGSKGCVFSVTVRLSSWWLDTDADLLKHSKSYFLYNINTPLNNSCSAQTLTHSFSEPVVYYQPGSRGGCTALSNEQDTYLPACPFYYFL